MSKIFRLRVTTGYVQYAFVCESLSLSLEPRTKNGSEQNRDKHGAVKERTDGGAAQSSWVNRIELAAMTDGRLWLLMNPGAQKRRTGWWLGDSRSTHSELLRKFCAGWEYRGDWRLGILTAVIPWDHNHTERNSFDENENMCLRIYDEFENTVCDFGDVENENSSTVFVCTQCFGDVDRNSIQLTRWEVQPSGINARYGTVKLIIISNTNESAKIYNGLAL